MKTKNGREISPIFQEGFEDAVSDMPNVAHKHPANLRTEYAKGYQAGTNKRQAREARGQY